MTREENHSYTNVDTDNPMKYALQLVVLLMIASGCARKEDNSEVPTPTSEAATEPASTSLKDVPLNAPPIVAPVTVNVSLSPKAEAQLASTGETIVVEAIYAGDPAPGVTVETNEFGLVDMGKAQKELKAGGIVKFEEDVIDKAMLPKVTGQPQIMLNIRSGKKASPTNVLACPFYWDSVKVASAKTVDIACKLLSEAP